MKFVFLSENAEDENMKLRIRKDRILKLFQIFQFPYSKPVCTCSKALYLILSVWLCITTNTHLALLAHVASRNMRAVSDTFRRCNASPHPPRKPNKNETRNHNNTLGPLRSPPPAANWNRASSTALCAVCSYRFDYISDAFFTVCCIVCMNVESGLLRSGC